MAASPLAMMMLDLDGTVCAWSSAAERLYGWSTDDVLGRFLPIVPEDRQDQFRRQLELVKEGFSFADREVVHLRNGGSFRVAVWALPVRDPPGGAYCLLMVQEVPEPRLTTNTPEYLAAIVASSEDAIIGKDLDGVITSWNPAAERLYGYAAAEVLGQPIATLMPPDRREELPAIMQRIARGERIEHYETVRTHKDGSRVHVSVSISPVRDSNGRIIGAASIARDITARQKADQERADLLIAEQQARARAEAAAARARSLQAITASLARAVTAVEVAEVVIEQGLAGVGAAAGTVGLLSDDGGRLELVRTLGYPDEMVAALRSMPVDVATPMTEAIRSGQPVWREPDTADQERFAYYHRHNRDYPAGAGLPLVVGSQVIGAIGLSFREPRSFDEDDRAFMLALAGQCSQALERARLYETERAAREQLDAILGGMADGVVVQDRDGSFIYANEAAARLAGFNSATEYIGAHSFQISSGLTVLDAAGRPFPYEQLPARRALRGEPVPEMIVRYQRRDTGEVRWSLTKSRAIRGVDGRPLAISIFHDITEQKRAEERLRFLAEAGAYLAGSLDVRDTLAAVTRLATTSIADWAIALLSSEGQEPQEVAIAHRDPAGQELLGELLRRYPPHPDDRSEFWRALRTGRAVLIPDVDDQLLTRVSRDPEHLRLLRGLGLTSALYVPLIARDHTLGVIGLFTVGSSRRFGQEDQAIAEEIAQRSALALDNARLYRRAHDAIRTRDEFLSIASHELRTPVTALSGVAQLLQRARSRGTLDDARLSRSLDQIRQSSERLAALTSDLLDVSRLQSGHFELRRQLLDIVGFTRDLVQRQGEQTDGGHELVFESDFESCVIEVDPARLEQVLANLLSNACKYSPEGGPIRVSVRQVGSGVQVEVQDRGIGLMPDSEDVIFQPFGRAGNAAERQIQGLGLGLYICRQIVERHGGRIWAESAGEGEGTTMRVWLPAAEFGGSGGGPDA